MSFNNHWTICSSFDFQAHRQRSQRWCFSQPALLWFEVLPGLSSALQGLSPAFPGAPKVLSGAPRCSQTYHNHSHGSPVAVIRDPSHSEGRPECPPRVWYSLEIDPSKFTLHILSDTPGVFQWLKYILLMELSNGEYWDIISLCEIRSVSFSALGPTHSCQACIYRHNLCGSSRTLAEPSYPLTLFLCSSLGTTLSQQFPSNALRAPPLYHLWT